MTTWRLYQRAIDALFARIGSGAAVDWYLTDHLGSIGDIVDHTGALQDHLEYDPFGTLLSESNPSYGARYLDPTTGRWTTQDPLGFAARRREFVPVCVQQPYPRHRPEWIIPT